VLFDKRLPLIQSNESEEMYPLRPDRKNRRIFCDESSQTGHRFFVLGGLYPDERHEDIENELEAIKLKYWLKDEVKWGKCPKKPGQFFDGYKALIEGFARLPIYMKVIIVDTEKYPLDHPTHFEGDAELGYFKFYYNCSIAVRAQKPSATFLGENVAWETSTRS
jgi:hypothetical protein